MAKIHNLRLRYKNEQDKLRKVDPKGPKEITRLTELRGALEAIDELMK